MAVSPPLVTPAKAGVQESGRWIAAFAAMTAPYGPPGRGG